MDTALSLAQKVIERVNKAISNHEDCKKLGSYAKQITSILENTRLALQSRDGPNLPREATKAIDLALAELASGLQAALDFVNECARTGKVGAFFKTTRISDRFSAVILDLDRGLRLIPLAALGVSGAGQAEAAALAREIRDARSEADRVNREALLELRQQMEAVRDAQLLGDAKTHDVLQGLLGALQRQGLVSADQPGEELASLRQDLEALREAKERREAEYLSQIIMALEIAEAATKPPESPPLNRSGTHKLRSRIEDSVTCPICAEIFTDPVSLTASGITYDLHCIREHARVSDLPVQCPVTRTILPEPVTVTVNIAVRKLVDDFHPADGSSQAKLRPHPGQGLITLLTKSQARAPAASPAASSASWPSSPSAPAPFAPAPALAIPPSPATSPTSHTSSGPAPCLSQPPAGPPSPAAAAAAVAATVHRGDRAEALESEAPGFPQSEQASPSSEQASSWQSIESNKALSDAAEQGDEPLVQLLPGSGVVDVNARDSNGGAPLPIATPKEAPARTTVAGSLGEPLRIRTVEGHSYHVLSVSFSPHDRDLLASASNDRTIKLWSVESGQCVQTLKGHRGPVTSISFSPHDQDLLASGSEDRTIKLWSVTSGQCVRTLGSLFRGHSNWVTSVSFSPHDQDLLASGSWDKTIKLWSIASGQCVRTLGGFLRTLGKGHCNMVTSVSFSPHDPDLLASGSSDLTIKLWSVASGQCMRTLDKCHFIYILSLSFSPHDRDLLASGSFDNTVKLWSVESGQCLQTLMGHIGPVTSVSFSPHDRDLLASSCHDNTIKLWSVGSGKCLRTLMGHMGPVTSVSFSPHDRDLLASGSEDRTIKLWSLALPE